MLRPNIQEIYIIRKRGLKYLFICIILWFVKQIYRKIVADSKVVKSKKIYLMIRHQPMRLSQ